MAGKKSSSCNWFFLLLNSFLTLYFPFFLSNTGGETIFHNWVQSHFEDAFKIHIKIQMKLKNVLTLLCKLTKTFNFGWENDHNTMQYSTIHCSTYQTVFKRFKNWLNLPTIRQIFFCLVALFCNYLSIFVKYSR